MTNTPSQVTPVIIPHSPVKHADYDYLFDSLTPSSPRLVIIASESTYEELCEVYETQIDTLFHVHLDPNNESYKEQFYAQVSTEYWIIATPDEIWGENMLSDLSTSLTDNPVSDSTIAYLTGFFSSSQGEIHYSELVSPTLSKPLELHQLFDSLSWFSPLIKLVFCTHISKEWSITPQSSESFFSAYYATVIDYLATMYTICNGTQPSIHRFPASFLVAHMTPPAREDLAHIRKSILAHSTIWQLSLWSKVYWKFLYFSKRYSHLLTTR